MAKRAELYERSRIANSRPPHESSAGYAANPGELLEGEAWCCAHEADQLAAVIFGERIAARIGILLIGAQPHQYLLAKKKTIRSTSHTPNNAFVDPVCWKKAKRNVKLESPIFLIFRIGTFLL